MNNELQQFIDDIGDSVNHVQVTPGGRELYKAALRAALSYAILQHKRRNTPPLTHGELVRGRRDDHTTHTVLFGPCDNCGNSAVLQRSISFDLCQKCDKQLRADHAAKDAVVAQQNKTHLSMNDHDRAMVRGESRAIDEFDAPTERTWPAACGFDDFDIAGYQAPAKDRDMCP